MSSDKKNGLFSIVGQFFRSAFARLQTRMMETMGLGRAATISALILIVLVAALIVFLFIRSTPPKTLIMTSGDDNSIFRRVAGRYEKVLARNGVTLTILPSEGSLQNLERLSNPAYRVDVGFVQSGLTKGQNIEKLMSLGSISYVPLFVFYRGSKPVEMLSELQGKRLAIGPDGSGTNAIATSLLAMNGIEPGEATELWEMDDEEAADDLIAGRMDAVFFMADSASSTLIRKLLKTPGIRLVNFTQADAYTRRLGYLNKLILPRGAIDFGKNIPEHDVTLLSPTVELVARHDLHPALSDLLLEAAQEIHGRTTLFQRRGEFPVPLENEFRLSDEATRYYKSGKTFFYRYFPFWMASLISRILVVLLPIILILIPGLRVIPAIYRWGTRMRILRWYRQLLALEQDMLTRVDSDKQRVLLERLDQIEQAVNNMKIPASFADQFYILRGHVIFVRNRLIQNE
jgi:TRAP-type uncharacterized transport system substrate-binding protein